MTAARTAPRLTSARARGKRFTLGRRPRYCVRGRAYVGRETGRLGHRVSRCLSALLKY